MKMSRIATWLMVTGLATAGALAQGYGEPPHPGNMPPAGFWPTPKMMDGFINRITDELGRIYGFDEDQVWNTRDSIKARFPQWMQEHRAELQELTNQYLESVFADEPPTPEEVAEWAQRAKPLFQEFTTLVNETTEEMRTYMTDEQQVILDGQKAAMDVGVNYMQQRLSSWEKGGYDWETEWPQSEKFKRVERDRRQRLEREARQAEAIAMGQNPDAGPVASTAQPGAAPDAGPTPDKAAAPTARPGAATPKDEWAKYVEDFIRRYQLEADQQTKARQFLRDQQDLRDKYVRRKMDAIKAVEDKLKAAQSEDERTKVQAELAELNRPIERYFERLKERLDTLPTRKQRQEAAKSDDGKRGPVHVSEEKRTAMREQMQGKVTEGKAGSGEKPATPPETQPK